jgi:hypothetical protein
MSSIQADGPVVVFTVQMLVIVSQNVGAHLVPELPQLVFGSVGPESRRSHMAMFKRCRPGFQRHSRVVYRQLHVRNIGPRSKCPSGAVGKLVPAPDRNDPLRCRCYCFDSNRISRTVSQSGKDADYHNRRRAYSMDSIDNHVSRTPPDHISGSPQRYLPARLLYSRESRMYRTGSPNVTLFMSTLCFIDSVSASTCKSTNADGILRRHRSVSPGKALLGGNARFTFCRFFSIGRFGHVKEKRNPRDPLSRPRHLRRGFYTSGRRISRSRAKEKP